MNVLITGSDLEMSEEVRLTLNSAYPDWNLSILHSEMECLNAIYSECPDIVVMGMRLFDSNCLGLLEQIRDESDVPVIALSGGRDVNTLVQAFEAGANDYIVYPFNRAIFVAKVKALVRRRNWDIRAIEEKLSKVKAVK
jgi:DNA-binding response OmpR family regulator